ncbi:hypothetical protein GCM10010404_20440 [Nonomuraea africana]
MPYPRPFHVIRRRGSRVYTQATLTGEVAGMGTELSRQTTEDPAVRSAERIVSSARLGELYECSALLRRTRQRAEEIVNEARAMLAEAELYDDPIRVLALNAQLEEARAAYRRILQAYTTICRKIAEERSAIIMAEVKGARAVAQEGLSGVA